MNFRLNKKTKTIAALIIAGSLFLSVPFLFSGFGFVILFAMVPVLFLEHYTRVNKIRFRYLYIYLTLLIWNAITTYWIAYAKFMGAIGAIVLNSLSFTIVLILFGWFRKRFGKGIGYLFLIFGWIAWEHLMIEGELNWPWLMLGNGFASSYKVVQWYEFTGVLGGSLWALLTSLLIFDIITGGGNCATKKEIKVKNFSLIALIIVPIFISHAMYISYKEAENPREFLIVQPNIDPYVDKFGGMTQKEQDDVLIKMLDENIGDSTLFVIAPETFTSGIVENEPYSSDSFNRFYRTMQRHGNAHLIIGASTHYLYPESDYPLSKRPSYTSRRINNGWYDSYNTAIFLDSTGKYELYHKSKLVPLVEFMPFPKYLGGFRLLVIELGGYFGSYGTQKERSVFTSRDSGTVIGTAICYESVYGNYYREYIHKGANVMSIITNDGWWLDSPGYRQHLWFDQLRAIETRRSIARCGNTGVSALINQRGDIVASTEWWTRSTLKGKLNLNEKITTFVKYGDFIGRIAYASMLIFIALAILSLLKISAKGKE